MKINSNNGGNNGQGGAISRFFRPKSASLKKNDEDEGPPPPLRRHRGNAFCSSAATVAVEHDSDGWQRPAGLTSDAAIEIVDDDDDGDHNDGPEEGNGMMNHAVLPIPSAELSKQDGTTNVDDSNELSKTDLSTENTNLCSDRSKGSNGGKENGTNVQLENTNETERPPCSTHQEETATFSAATTTVATKTVPPSSTTVNTNPFEAFAFSASSANGDNLSYATTATKTIIPAFKTIPANKETKRPLSGSFSATHRVGKDKKKRLAASTKRKCEDYIPVKELPETERNRIRKKWQSMADPDASLETRRFQVLVAARLHARAQEPVIKAAMERLRKHFDEEERDHETTQQQEEQRHSDSNIPIIPKRELCASALSQSDPVDIATVIKSVNFPNAKARHIVQEANEVCRYFGGAVPQTRNDLMKLTGIGEKLADILGFVNSRKAWSSADEESRKFAVTNDK